MSQFKSICPHCFMHYRLDTSFLGKIAQCSGCRKTFVLEGINETMSFMPDLDDIVPSADEDSHQKSGNNEKNDIGEKPGFSPPQPSSTASRFPKVPNVGKSPIGRNPNKSTVISEKNKQTQEKGGFGKIVLNSGHSDKSPDDITDLNADAENVQTDSLPLETEITSETPEGIWNVGDVILGIYEVRPLAPGLPYAQGGVGIVQRIYHREWDMDLAMKSPKPGTFRSEVGMSTYERECQTWIELGLHPNIVTCYLIRRMDNLPRIFAEFIPDGSLRDWIADKRLYDGGPDVSLLRILDIAIQFAWGLDYAHRQGLLHLDVKPANVMMADSIPKVTDFGLAQATSGIEDGAGTSKWEGMTPGYCSPEQYEAYMNFRQKTRDPNLKMTLQSDIWSWAISVLSMFYGHAPCRKGGQTAARVFEAFLAASTPAQYPKIPPGMVSIMRHCFQTNPKDRPRSMMDVAERIIDVYAQLSGAPYPRTVPSTTRISAESLNNRAVSLLDLNKEKEAETLFLDALRIDPNHPETVYNQTLHLWRNGVMTDQEAVERINTLVKIRNEAVAFFALGLTQRERGNIAPAMLAFEKAVEKQERPDFQKAIESAQLFTNKSVRCTDRLSFHRSNGPVAYLNERENFLILVLDPQRFLFYDLKTYRKSFILKRSESDSLQSSEETNPMYDGDASLSSDTWPEIGDFEEEELPGPLRPPTSRLQPHRIAMSEDFQWELFQDGSIRNLILTHVRNLSEPIAFHEIPWGTTQLDLRGTVDSGQWTEDGGEQKFPTLPTNNFSLQTTNHTPHTTNFAESKSSTKLSYVQGLETTHPHSGVDLSAFTSSSNFATDSVYNAASSTENSNAVFLDIRLQLDEHNDHEIQIVNQTHDTLVGSLRGHQQKVLSISHSGTKGEWIATGSKDRTIRLWDISSCRCVRTFASLDGSVDAVYLSRSGRHLFAIIGGNSLRIWDVEILCRNEEQLHAPILLCKVASSEEVSRRQNEITTFQKEFDVVMHEDDYAGAVKLLAKIRKSDAWDMVRREVPWDKLLQKCVREKPGETECVHTFRGHEDKVASVALSIDGQLAVSAGNDNTIRMWNTETGKCVRVIEGHSDWIRDVAITWDGRYILSGSWDSTVRIWSTGSGRCVRILDDRVRSISKVAFHPLGRIAAIATAGGSILLWNIVEDKVIGNWSAHRGSVNSLSFNRDGRFLLSAGDDAVVCIWDTVSQRLLRKSHPGKSPITAAKPLMGRLEIVSAAKDGTIDILPVHQLSNSASHRAAGSVSDRNELGSGGYPVVMSGHVAEISSLEIIADNRFFVSASRDQTIKIWKLADRTLQKTLSGHSGPITGMAVDFSGTKILSGSEDGTVRFWNIFWNLSFPGFQDWDPQAEPVLRSLLSLYCNDVTGKGSPKPQPQPQSLQRILLEFGYRGFGWIRTEEVRDEIKRMLDHWKSGEWGVGSGE